MEALTIVLAGLRSEIQRRHRNQLRCIGWRIDTDDLYQTVCLRAWRARAQCSGRTATELRNWVLKIAANEARNALACHLDCACRTVRRTTGEPLPWQHGHNANPLEELIAREDQATQARLLRRGLRKVTPKRRQAIRMYYLDERPYAQIAAQMGIGIGHARSLASGGVKDIRELVGA